MANTKENKAQVAESSQDTVEAPEVGTVEATTEGGGTEHSNATVGPDPVDVPENPTTDPAPDTTEGLKRGIDNSVDPSLAEKMRALSNEQGQAAEQEKEQGRVQQSEVDVPNTATIPLKSDGTPDNPPVPDIKDTVSMQFELPHERMETAEVRHDTNDPTYKKDTPLSVGRSNILGNTSGRWCHVCGAVRRGDGSRSPACPHENDGACPLPEPTSAE